MLTREELSRRLEDAARVRVQLRRATLEWRALGERLLEARRRGPERSDDRDHGGR